MLSKCRGGSRDRDVVGFPAEGRTNDKSHDRTSELFVHENKSVQASVRSHGRAHKYLYPRRIKRDIVRRKNPNSSSPLSNPFVRAKRSRGLRETGGP